MNQKQKYTIAVDFDGTLVTHEFPHIGIEIPFAVSVVKDLILEGHELILYTMRSDHYLEEAVSWCKDNGLHFHHINTNPSQDIWTKSPKVYAQIYIDDAALGCPLLHGPLSRRPYVDWRAVRNYLEQRFILPFK